MTARLKAGDKVQLRKYLRVGNDYGTSGGLTFLANMKRDWRRKKVMKVKYVTSHGTAKLSGSDFIFDVAMLVKAQKGVKENG